MTELLLIFSVLRMSCLLFVPYIVSDWNVVEL